MRSLRRLLSALLLLASSPMLFAAPAPFPKPDRGAPTMEQLLLELKQQGVEVRRVERAGPTTWAVTISRSVLTSFSRVPGGRRVVEVTMTVSGTSDPRSALRTFLKPREEDTRTKY